MYGNNESWEMSAVESYTPLERFLLFETLHPWDSDSGTISFVHASEALKSHAKLKEGKAYDSTRLEPGPLESLYLGLMKEEVKLGQGHKATEANRAELPQSPLLMSLTDAAKYKHLLPQLLDRLYFGYRDHAIKAIEDEERSIRQLRRDIEEIQRVEREAPSRKSSIQTLLRHDTVEDRPRSRDNGQILKSPQQHIGELRPTSRIAEDPARAIISNGETLLAATAVLSSSVDVPPAETRPQSQSSLLESSPFIPPPQQQPPSFGMASPKSEVNRRPPLPSNPSRPNLAPSLSPRLNQGPSERSSGSPIILPPPAGMRHSGSPHGPLDTLADMAGQQFRARPPLPSPRSAQPAGGPYPPQYPPHSYTQQPYSYYDGRPQYSGPYQPYSQGPATPYSAHASYSPYQAPMQSPGPVQQYPNVSPYPPPVPQYPQYSTYGQTLYYPQTPRQGPFGPPSYPASAQHTPLTSASGKPRPPRPSPIITPVSSTRWKGIGEPQSVRSIPSPTRPGPDEISPISDRAPSAPPNILASQPADQSIISTKPPPKPSKRALRSGSTASALRTRSPSLASPTEPIKPEPALTPAPSDAPSLPDEPRKSTRRRRDTARGRELAEEQKPTRPAPITTKRKRTSTQGSPSAPTPSDTGTTTTPGPTTQPQGKVLGTRNFPRTSAPIMYDISSHKLAGMFARPLTEREAPGYRDLIYRPQDLKSIRSAIAAGTRALAASSSETAGEGASVLVAVNADVVPPRGIVNSAQLEKELMRMFANAVMFNPDSKRGIPAALRGRGRGERHVPAALREEQGGEEEEGEEEGSEEEGGLVRDTREMCEAVEAKVEGWRLAENLGAGKGEKVRRRGEDGEETVGEETGEEVEREGGKEMEVVKEKEVAPTVSGKRRRRR